MKLYYFNQDTPDADDWMLARARRDKIVPEGCLLGGRVVAQFLPPSKPCDACGGPRERCGGTPRLSDAELGQAADRERIKALFMGSDVVPIDALRRKT